MFSEKEYLSNILWRKSKQVPKLQKFSVKSLEVPCPFLLVSHVYEQLLQCEPWWTGSIGKLRGITENRFRQLCREPWSWRVRADCFTGIASLNKQVFAIHLLVLNLLPRSAPGCSLVTDRHVHPERAAPWALAQPRVLQQTQLCCSQLFSSPAKVYCES